MNSKSLEIFKEVLTQKDLLKLIKLINKNEAQGWEVLEENGKQLIFVNKFDKYVSVWFTDGEKQIMSSINI